MVASTFNIKMPLRDSSEVLTLPIIWSKLEFLDKQTMLCLAVFSLKASLKEKMQCNFHL